MSNKSFFHPVAVVIVAIWGLTFISTKTLLLAGLRPDQIFFIRFSIAYAGMWGICLFGNGKAADGGARLFCGNWKDEMRMLASGITGGSLYFWTENSALSYTDTCNVSFIVCTAPLLTALLFAAVRKERLGKWLILGSLLALSGIAMIAFSGSDGFHLGIIGDLLALSAAATWAFYTLFTKDLLEKYPSNMVTRKVFFYGLLTIVPVLVHGGWDLSLTQLTEPKVLWNILFLGVIASLVCYVLWNLVIKNLGGIESSNYIYLNPIFTLMGATMILHETLTPVAAAGCLLTLAGVWTAARR